MKIQQSEVSFLSSHHKEHKLYESESLETWNTEEDAPQRFQERDRLELSDNFKELQKGAEVDKTGDASFEVSLSPELMAIVRALESLTGKKINLSFMHSFNKPQAIDKVNGEAREGTLGYAIEVSKSEDVPVERLGWGIDYNYERHEVHSESLDFSAGGSVKTEDGRDIDFSLAFSMQNHSELHESVSFKAGDALIDPLVLNFDGNVVSISDVKHEFDLDLDGKSDEFSFVGSGSGFLALDKNGDGIINDGSELFGPSKGNGFNELAAYDSDGNNWIDENDEIFNQLLIWTKDEEGNENLFSLKDKDVGALYLGRVDTQFDLKANSGELQGVMRESSIYLSEGGGVGTLQEIDLVV